MSTEDLEKYETEMELQLYREYRDIVRQFSYANVAAVAGRAPRGGTVGVASAAGLLPQARVGENGDMVGVEGTAR